MGVSALGRVLFLLASLTTGLSVAVAGVIGFVGLVVPHFMRLFVGGDHRILLPASWLCGAVFLVLCDTIARTVLSPAELRVLAKKLAAASDPKEAARLKERLTRGFYGI